jgi:hypothetical protein
VRAEAVDPYKGYPARFMAGLFAFCRGGRGQGAHGSPHLSPGAGLLTSVSFQERLVSAFQEECTLPYREM